MDYTKSGLSSLCRSYQNEWKNVLILIFPSFPNQITPFPT